MATTLSIEAYKRKQNVLAVKAQKRRVRNSTPKESYTSDQRRYLEACVEKLADLDPRLLAALREARFVLKLDRFGKEELAFNMAFLQKTKTCSHISLSLGSVTINRDLRTKFDRLGLKRAYAYENEGAAVVVRSACAAAYKTPNLVRFHLIGVSISPEVSPLLSKALFHCHRLEDVSLNGSNLGDEGLEAIAIALGKCPELHLVSLAGCGLTDKSKDPIAKIIALHGVIKDESTWSSSLRGEAPPVASSPDLMINLSRNSLGDETAEAICDALHNDKWLLGLNLGSNLLSRQGTELFLDTLTKRNQTLAVLALANMKTPVGRSTLSSLGSILHDRNRYLQQVATESREKRMALGGLLLEWGVDKDTVVEVCYLETLGKVAKGKGDTPETGPKKSTLASPKARADRVQPQSAVSNGSRASLHDNNNSNDSSEEDDEGGDSNDDVAASTADSHVKTIEYLIEQLSSLEAEKRKMQEYMKRIEAENRQLRAELIAQPRTGAESGISPIEARIIAQLETSISSLADQVEFMELEKNHKSSTS
ncbi:hypothetical protein GN244_ATG08951 [Phytophthora infestans]|uniref:RNI-like protein n=1 Tax=Phytophthora infestans TaxID=4787 RepID=A0A833WVD1_PHYIN|nr:hypothetical protein GN244_ATG08951 [Phytophthora infestans]KAF4127467.1 hypothetical protein GN958_ATG23342 [Phytophthora infestans]